MDKQKNLNSDQVNVLNNIKEKLTDQSVVQEHQTEILKRTEQLAEQDRLLQVAQVYEEHQIQKDEDLVVKTLESIDEGIKSLSESISKALSNQINKLVSPNSTPIVERDENGNVESVTKLIRSENVIQEDKARAKQEYQNRSSATKTLDFLHKNGIVKRGSEGVFARMFGVPELAKQEEKDKYIARQREFGSEETDQKLGKNFEELQTALHKKEIAQKDLEKTKSSLNLTDQQVSQTNTGKSLLDDIQKLNDLIGRLDSSLGATPEKSKAELPNDTLSERESEVNRIRAEDNELLHKIEENTRVKEVEAPENTIPEALEDLKNTLAIAIRSLKGSVKDTGSNIGDVVTKAKNIGGTLINGAKAFASTAAVPLAIGVVGATAANYAANKFSKSFGEGGFDVIHALHKQGIIDYNFGDSEILDWKAVEQLDNDTIDKMIKSDEFSEEDVKKLEDIIKGNKMTFKPAIEQARLNLKEKNLKPYDLVNTDYVLKPEVDKSNYVYKQSADNADKALAPAVSPNNIVVAPTTVNNTSKTTQNIRLPVRNDDDTTRRFVSSRYSK